MAECTLIDPKPSPPPEFELHLTEPEAQTLVDLIRNCCGERLNTRFVYLSRIADALGDVGIVFDGERATDVTGEIRLQPRGDR